jgi:hypothetical protein
VRHLEPQLKLRESIRAENEIPEQNESKFLLEHAVQPASGLLVSKPSHLKLVIQGHYLEICYPNEKHVAVFCHY